MPILFEPFVVLGIWWKKTSKYPEPYQKSRDPSLCSGLPMKIIDGVFVKSSIRKFLLINLLLAITFTTSLTAIGNYFLDQNDIQDHLDTLMAVSALSYQALLGKDLPHRPLKAIQDDLQNIPENVASYYPKPRLYEQGPDYYRERFNLQIWSDDGKLLLHSPNAPSNPLNPGQTGFTDNVVNKTKWRVFTSYSPEQKARTVVAERYDTRNDLGQRIAEDDIYILLLTFPLSGLLIWIIIGRGLKSLDTIAHEVADRKSSHLEPVNMKEVPREVKPLVDELNKLFFRLQEGFEREKRFAADAAHELRTPLAALKTQAQVALNSNTIEEKDLALQKLIASVNRSTHIVQQLLTMSKLVPEASGANALDEVDLNQVTRDVLTMLVPTALDKQVDLEFEANENLPPFLGNSTAIGILIRNLVDNAIRYGDINNRIVVRTYQQANEIILEVRDHGPGIPLELHGRVFERFFRVLGNKKSGSGLGLAIVQQICMLHQAQITLEAPPDHGPGLVVKVTFHSGN